MIETIVHDCRTNASVERNVDNSVAEGPRLNIFVIDGRWPLEDLYPKTNRRRIKVSAVEREEAVWWSQIDLLAD